MTLEELEVQILALDPAEKAEVIQILTQTLTNGSQGIKKTPGVCGGDAWVVLTICWSANPKNDLMLE